MQKLMMSLPWRARAFTSASTTKAFSVPREAARRLISAMGLSGDNFLRTKDFIGVRSPRKSPGPLSSHADQLRRLPGRPQARRHRARADQRLPRPVEHLRLGGDEGSDAGGARGD